MSKASANGTNGSHWIRPEKRVRIYQRDGWVCAWCGRPVYSAAHADGERLAPGPDAQPATLDHYCPRGVGGEDNRASNLVTACLSCNSARGLKRAHIFALVVSQGDESAARGLLANMRRTRRKVLPVLEG